MRNIEKFSETLRIAKSWRDQTFRNTVCLSQYFSTDGNAIIERYLATKKDLSTIVLVLIIHTDDFYSYKHETNF